MIPIRHFIIFQTVANTGTFTRAAQKLYITQSAVSHSIRELEEYTGTVLFDRFPKQVRLTPGGKLLLQEITPILSAYEALDRRIGCLTKQAPFHIVSSITIAGFWLPRLLLQFKKQKPDIPVYVKVVSAANAVGTLLKGNADLALIEGGTPEGPFHKKTFASCSLQVVCAPDYALPASKMDIPTFCAENLLLREPGSAIRDILDSQLLLLGHTVHPLWESVNSTALIEAAKTGLGITVLPEVLIKNEISNHSLIPLLVSGLSLNNDLTALWHKNQSMTPALETFLSLLSDIPQF